MFSQDAGDAIQSICETAKEFAKSEDKEIQKRALDLLEKALDLLADEI